jgi:hypothetical protein
MTGLGTFDCGAGSKHTIKDSMQHSAQIRAWVYERLRKPLMTHIAPLQQVVSDVQSMAEQHGLVEKRPIQPYQTMTPWIEDEVREVVWALAFQGILVPGIDNGQQASLPWFKITEWGKRCLEKHEYLPFDAGLFIERIRNEIPALDSVVQLYLAESLKCFRYDAFVAAAAMVGVAAERMMLVLQGAVYGALDTEEKKERFSKDAAGSIKRVFDAIWKKLDPVREQMPDNLRESLRVELDGIFELIRKTRNEAGHPTGRNIEREEAQALLLLFPTYAKTAYAAVGWLAKQPL